MDLLEQHCTCGVCLDLFDSNVNLPRSLNCGHTFCDRCIHHLRENGDRLLRCPSCKSTQYVSSSSLPVNYQILGLADDLRTKRESNERWSLRSLFPFSVPSVQSIITMDTLFYRMSHILATRKASESLVRLESICERLKMRSRELPFSRVSNSLERLKVKCENLSVSPSLRLLSTENPIDSLRQSDRLIELINRSSDLIAEKLIETEMFLEDQLHSLSDNESTREKGVTAPPIPPRRKFIPQSGKPLNDRYSSGFSLATSLTSIFMCTLIPMMNR